jgi:hypothetical protein
MFRAAPALRADRFAWSLHSARAGVASTASTAAMASVVWGFMAYFLVGLHGPGVIPSARADLRSISQCLRFVKLRTAQ